MTSTPPFIDHTTGTLDTDQIIKESIPLSKLIAAVGVVALLPFAIATTFGLFERVFILHPVRACRWLRDRSALRDYTGDSVS